MTGTYYIETYGCQMNENDSEIISGLLEQCGYVISEKPEGADIIITNTCSVRDSAERKAKGFISYTSRFKQSNPSTLIGVIGCMAERLGEELKTKYKHVDFVIGPNKEKDIVAVIENLAREKSCAVLTGDSLEFRDSLAAKRKKEVNAWVTIMEGCDNFCSYCIVPYVRGREKSRPVKDIINEISQLDKSVFKEITLLGQNVNSYGYGFAKLLKEASDIQGVLRVRFMTSHPKDMSDEIISAVKDIPKVCENFHIPFQSGDNEILKKMNRGYDRKYYIDLVKRIRDKVPSAAITSDAIAGFPGETDSQFQNTLDLIKDLELDAINTLAFNPRPMTKAALMEGQISESIKSERLKLLMTVVQETVLKRNQKLIGETMEILVEKVGSGRTRTNKIVKFVYGKEKAGDILNARIKNAKSWVLDADIIN